MRLPTGKQSANRMALISLSHPITTNPTSGQGTWVIVKVDTKQAEIEFDLLKNG